MRNWAGGIRKGSRPKGHNDLRSMLCWHSQHQKPTGGPLDGASSSMVQITSSREAPRTSGKGNFALSEENGVQLEKGTRFKNITRTKGNVWHVLIASFVFFQFTSLQGLHLALIQASFHMHSTVALTNMAKVTVTLERIISVSNVKWVVPSRGSVKGHKLGGQGAQVLVGQMRVCVAKAHWGSGSWFSFIHGNSKKGSPANLNPWL